jgi:hypothetical protein
MAVYTHAGVTNEHGVVFGAASEDLERATNLLIPADDGVEFPLAGEGGEVDSIFAEGVETLFRIRIGEGLAFADSLHGLLDGALSQALLAQKVPNIIFRFGEGEPKVVYAYILVFEAGGLLEGFVQGLLEGRAQGRRPRSPL